MTIFTGMQSEFGYSDAIINRQNERYKRIILENLEHIEGKFVLDLGSHDGRWQWASLKSGAKHVIGVEGRKSLIDRSKKLLDEFPMDSWSVYQDDFFDWLTRRGPSQKVDTILCLGIFYHLLDHNRFIELISQTTAKAAIFDSGYIDDDRLFVYVESEDTSNILNAIGKTPVMKKKLIGFASRGFFEELVRQNGWKCELIVWKASDMDRVDGCHDYLQPGRNRKMRFTYRLVR